MTPVDWVVVAAGLLTIVWINWYFYTRKGAEKPC